MSTKLPLIRAYVSNELKEKMERIAEENDRSISKEITRACRHWIALYEEQHGEIKIGQNNIIEQ